MQSDYTDSSDIPEPFIPNGKIPSSESTKKTTTVNNSDSGETKVSNNTNNNSLESPEKTGAEQLLSLKKIAENGSLEENQKWKDVAKLLSTRLTEVLFNLKEEEEPKSWDKHYKVHIEYIHNAISSFDKEPFTLQRMAELLVEQNVYATRERFVFAFRKLVANVSTISDTTYNQMVLRSHKTWEQIVANRKKLWIDEKDPPDKPSPMQSSDTNDDDDDDDDDSSADVPPPPPGAMEVDNITSSEADSGLTSDLSSCPPPPGDDDDT